MLLYAVALLAAAQTQPVCINIPGTTTCLGTNANPLVTTGGGGGGSSNVNIIQAAGVNLSGGVPAGVLPSAVPDQQQSGTLNALNATIQIATSGGQGVGFQLNAGTLHCTIVPEISVDNGTTWLASMFGQFNSTFTAIPNISSANANLAATLTILTIPGTRQARVRCSTFASGSSTGVLATTNQPTFPTPFVYVQGSPNFSTLTVSGAGSLLVAGLDTNGSSPTTGDAPIKMGAIDTSGLVRTVQSDTSSRLIVVGPGVAGTPAGGVLSVQGVVGGTPVPISGSITASNPSVGTNGAAIPGSSTLVGGSDGTNLQPFRVNTVQTALASASRTTATQSSAISTFNARCAKATLNVTVASGTGGLSLTIQGQDTVSSTFYNLNVPPPNVTGTGLFVYEVCPGTGSASGGVTQRTNGSIDPNIRINVAVGDASAYTYSVGLNLTQ